MRNHSDLALTFVVTHSRHQARHTITKPIIKIGRDPASHLILDDPLASRMQAVIEVEADGNITLIDLGNAHPTKVNDSCINRCRLRRGDTITVGASRIVLEAIETLEDRIARAEPIDDTASSAATITNPFLQPAAEVTSACEYAMVPAAPSVPADEVEDDVDAIEIRVLWGRNQLAVHHLKMDQRFTLGAGGDFVLPEALLGRTQACLVDQGRVHLVTADMASVQHGDGPAESMTQTVSLRREMVVRQQLGDVEFVISGIKRGKNLGAGFTLAALLSGAAAYVLGSFAAHAGLLAAMAMFMPPLGASEDDVPDDAQRYLIQQYLDAAADKEREAREEEQLQGDDTPGSEGGSGTRAKHEEGKMGKANSNASNRRWAAKGTNPNVELSRQRALREARDYGMIGIINVGNGGDTDAPVSPWGGLTTDGNDPISADGNMWGAQPGDAHGMGGLGLSGIGEGSGGMGKGLGLGNIGTYGHGSGIGNGNGFGDGFGGGGRLAKRRHKTAVPRLRGGGFNSSGRIPPEVIQRIVRANYGRFRSCYQAGLRNNPSLQGRVVVRFVIGRDGRVSGAGGGGDLPDAGVVSCVARSFGALTFPRPEGGIVTVSYGISLTPVG